MEMKKILFLGGANFQTNIILKAKKMGYFTICLDNKRENPGHKIANKSYLISTLDKNNIYEIAKKENISGIISHGSDVSLRSLAFIAESLGIHGPSQHVVDVLTNKSKFKKFLKSHFIQKQNFIKYNKSNFKSKLDKINKFILTNKIVYFKPEDSSGGKGISKVDKIDQVNDAIAASLKDSLKGEGLVEQTFKNIKTQLCGDGFILDGQIKFIGFGEGLFLSSRFTPYAEVFPTKIKNKFLEKIKFSIEEVFKLLNYRNGPFNIDIIILNDGSFKILELTPRCGGNYLM